MQPGQGFRVQPGPPRSWRPHLLALLVPTQTEQQGVALPHVDPLGFLSRLQVLGEDRLAGFQPLLALDLSNVQKHSPGDNAVLHVVNVARGGLFLHAYQGCRPPVVHFAVPKLVAEAIQMGEGKAVNREPDEGR